MQKRGLSVENIIRFCLYFFVTEFSCHLDKCWASTRGTLAWGRWHLPCILHLDKMTETLQDGFSDAISEPKQGTSPSSASVLRNSSAFFNTCLQIQLQLLRYQKHSGGQSVLSLNIQPLAQGKRTHIYHSTCFWTVWSPLPGFIFLGNLNTS